MFSIGGSLTGMRQDRRHQAANALLDVVIRLCRGLKPPHKPVLLAEAVQHLAVHRGFW
jgi:hypothetical protein